MVIKFSKQIRLIDGGAKEEAEEAKQGRKSGEDYRHAVRLAWEALRSAKRRGMVQKKGRTVCWRRWEEEDEDEQQTLLDGGGPIEGAVERWGSEVQLEEVESNEEARRRQARGRLKLRQTD